ESSIPPGNVPDTARAVIDVASLGPSPKALRRRLPAQRERTSCLRISALRRKRGQRIGGAFACERQVPCGAAHEPCQDAGPPRRGCGDCRSSGQAPRRACPPALGQPCGLPTVPTASTTNVRKVAKPRRAARRPRSPDPLPPPSTKSAFFIPTALSPTAEPGASWIATSSATGSSNLLLRGSAGKKALQAARR